MKVTIIDPGFTHLHAHHATVNLGINEALLVHRASTSVIASYSLEEEARQKSAARNMTVIPYFRTPCYPRNAESLGKVTYSELSLSFSEEIIELYNSNVLEGDENLLIHTAFSFHYAGLARALWHIKKPISGQILICLMFNPGARILEDQIETLSCIDAREFLRHKLAFRLLECIGLRDGLKIQLASSCKSYQRVYETIWGAGEVNVHPSVCYRPLSNPQLTSDTARRKVLLYLGGAKSNKGFEFSAALGVLAAKAFKQTEFVFHFNHEFPGAEQFTGAVENLKKAGTKYDNVRILYGNLDDSVFDELIVTCDIICLLYDPAHYGFKTSGIFWEALRSAGKYWLVTSESWPASELKELRIPHETVPFGDVESSFSVLKGLLGDKKDGAWCDEFANVDLAYLSLLNQSYGDWIHLQFDQNSHDRCSFQKQISDEVELQSPVRILIVRTNYGHFGELSGPGGFVPHLREMGYEVDERFVELGANNLMTLNEETRGQFWKLTQEYISSYQVNSLVVESEIQRDSHLYDIVHFVDGEHCGLLSALYKLMAPSISQVKLIATFHQPLSIMNELVNDPRFLNGFDSLHLMSPDQADFFEQHVDEDKLKCVPHGLAQQLLSGPTNKLMDAEQITRSIPGFRAATKGKKILLTVGNWLRDFDTLKQTAFLLEKRKDIVFVIVSKGLDLDITGSTNIILINQGVNDEELHALYTQASLLFLPLKDGAANNAILEAMAHGLAIVATDIPATHYYSKENAFTAPNESREFASLIESTLHELGDTGRRVAMSMKLKVRAQELSWEKVAKSMHQMLYTRA